MCLFIHMLMLLDIAITGGVNLRRRKIVRRDNGKVVEFEEVKYGMLMMVLCDREGRVYDVCL